MGWLSRGWEQYRKGQLPDAPPRSPDMSGIIHVNNTFYAVGGSLNSSEIASSPDGVTWSGAFPSSYWLRAIAYGNGAFVTVGYGNSAIISTDGVNWVAGPAHSLDARVEAIAYGNNTFVAVGGVGLYSSPDGRFWAPHAASTRADLRSIAFGGRYFVAVGNQGTILTSTDGTTWSSATSGTANSLTKVIYANGTFIAVGASRTILRSGSTTDQGGGKYSIKANFSESGNWMVTVKVTKDSLDYKEDIELKVQ